MEDINQKAHNDELNKSYEEIHESPRRRIAVPKVQKENKGERTEAETHGTGE